MSLAGCYNTNDFGKASPSFVSRNRTTWTDANFSLNTREKQ